jgi:hypothetical protein
MAKKKQPAIGFQVVSNRYIGLKPAYWTIFPANFRPNFNQQNRRAAWAGVLQFPGSRSNRVHSMWVSNVPATPANVLISIALLRAEPLVQSMRSSQ